MIGKTVRRVLLSVSAAGIVLFSASCSISKIAMNMVADSLTAPGANTVFTGDNDPQLVADALPFAIKLYESLLSANPKHHGLILTTGSLYVMYANAFVQSPADYLPSDRIDDKLAAEKRAENLYLRGRDMLIKGLDYSFPGIAEALTEGDPKPFLAKVGKDYVPDLYWIAAGWFSAASLDSMNVSLSLHIQNARACLDRAYALDPDYEQGTLDEMYIQVLSSLPAELGGSREGAEAHYELALKKNGGKSAGTYVAWASTVLINEQKKDEFIATLNKALAIDPDAVPSLRLVNTLNQARARWYLKNVDDFFFQ